MRISYLREGDIEEILNIELLGRSTRSIRCDSPVIGFEVDANDNRISGRQISYMR